MTIKQFCLAAIGLMAIALATTSCDEYGKAKTTVADFMEENLNSGSPSDLEFVGIDSTLFVNDSMVVAMRRQAESSGQYKQGAEYAPLPAPRKLIFVKTSFLQGNEKSRSRHTFYLGDDQKQVFCVKVDTPTANE